MAEAAHAQPAWALIAYLIAGVCFILALRGLSSPESSRRGNRLGIIGMAIAVVTTLVMHVQQLSTPLVVEDIGVFTTDYPTVCEIHSDITRGGAIPPGTARMST